MSARTCETCQHWRPVKTAMQTSIGECRIWPPHGQFNWPRTRDIDACGQWAAQQRANGGPGDTAAQQVAIQFATGVSEAAQAASDKRGGESAGAVAPEASRSTAPQTDAATPARPARAAKAAKAEAAGRPAPLLPSEGGGARE